MAPVCQRTDSAWCFRRSILPSALLFFSVRLGDPEFFKTRGVEHLLGAREIARRMPTNFLFPLILGFGCALCASTGVCMVSSRRVARPPSHICLGNGPHPHPPASPRSAAAWLLDRWLPVAWPLPQDPPLELGRSV